MVPILTSPPYRGRQPGAMAVAAVGVPGGARRPVGGGARGRWEVGGGRGSLRPRWRAVVRCRVGAVGRRIGRGAVETVVGAVVALPRAGLADRARLNERVAP